MFEEFIKCFRPFKRAGHDADVAHSENEFDTPDLWHLTAELRERLVPPRKEKEDEEGVGRQGRRRKMMKERKMRNETEGDER
ncbi:hypothetical protein EYF80_041046 [Liparis tanakae]|uniref:Uncharacterized protein n=1 Tax=Liparis tanakae TaxID=230148 RepID=A0A4Z2G815_9TELE|nr:hypothetical protein EYF80_041046 [Liparis tanakae]